MVRWGLLQACCLDHLPLLLVSLEGFNIGYGEVCIILVLVVEQELTDGFGVQGYLVGCGLGQLDY